MTEYRLTTINEQGKINRIYKGYIKTEDNTLERFHPSHPQANKLKYTHDKLIKQNPKIKSLTTIVKEN